MQNKSSSGLLVSGLKVLPGFEFLSVCWFGMFDSPIMFVGGCISFYSIGFEDMESDFSLELFALFFSFASM